MLAAWRDDDLPLWRREAWARNRLNGRRDDAYRKVAAWLCSKASAVIVDAWDIPPLARAQEQDVAADAAARANRVMAAPGYLRQAVIARACQDGVQVIRRTPEHQVHWECGEPLPAGQRAASETVWCSPCGTEVDQDRNMLRLMAADPGTAES